MPTHRTDALSVSINDRGPFEGTDTQDRHQLLRFLTNLIKAATIITLGQVVVYAGNGALVSVLILCAVALLVLASLIGREFVLRGRARRGIAITSLGLFASGVACAFFDPRVMTVAAFATLLAVGLAMPFVTSRELLWVCIAGELTIGAIGIAGVFFKLFSHSYTTVSSIAMLVALLLAAGVSLSWLLGFHQRLSGLVADLKAAREGLERQVAERTLRLREELTRARELEAELRKARELIVIASDEERRRLRRELHDEFSPALGGCILTLDRLKETMGGTVEGRATIDRVSTNLHTLRTEIRQLSYQLIPEFLDLGLATAIRQMAEDFRSRHPATTMNLTLPTTVPELPAAVERAAYHVVQGALRNIEQHAHAHKCDIEVTLADDLLDKTQKRLCISVADDGVGLPMWHRPGVGLTTMRERVETLGGSLDIRAGDAAGVQIAMCIPLSVMATPQA